MQFVSGPARPAEGPADIAVARAAVRLIAERRHNRDRDLAALLEEYLADLPRHRTHY